MTGLKTIPRLGDSACFFLAIASITVLLTDFSPVNSEDSPPKDSAAPRPSDPPLAIPEARLQSLPPEDETKPKVLELARAESLFASYTGLKEAYITAATGRFEQQCLRYFGLGASTSQTVQKLCGLVEDYERKWADLQIAANSNANVDGKELARELQLKFKESVIGLIGAEDHRKLFQQISSPVQRGIDGIVGAALLNEIPISKSQVDWMHQTIEESGLGTGAATKDIFERLRNKAALELPPELNGIFQLHIDACEITYSVQ